MTAVIPNVVTPEEVASPETQALAEAILEWTGWSNGELAQVLSVPTETADALLAGEPPPPSTDLANRLAELNDFVAKVNILAKYDPLVTNRFLSTPYVTGERAGRSAMDFLSSRKPGTEYLGKAYLAVLDVLNDRLDPINHPDPPMMQSVFPASVRGRTIAMEDIWAEILGSE